MRPVTPRGFRDVLPEEAAEREALVSRLGETLAAWGYERVETPVVERLDVLETAAGPLEGTAFRLLDLDGELLALRPDLTVPIARLISARLIDKPGPFRLRYVADAFREHESLRGQSRQFTQVGIELVGSGGPAADAEVVAVLVEALRVAGLGDFTVAVGSVAVFSAVVEAAEMPAAWGESVVAAAHERNLVALDRLADEAGVSAIAARALRAVPRIRGGAEAIEACRIAATGCGCDVALDGLAETFSLLQAAKVAESVTVDFSVMRSFGYYTGIVVEAYASGVGVPLGGGGRYDGVLGRYGTPAPAAGFALGLERLGIALLEQGAQPRARALDAVLGGDPAEALRAAAELRNAGWRIVLSERTGLELVREAERRGAVEALEASGGTLVRLDRDGQRALPITTPLPYPPSTTWAEGSERP